VGGFALLGLFGGDGEPEFVDQPATPVVTTVPEATPPTTSLPVESPTTTGMLESDRWAVIESDFGNGDVTGVIVWGDQIIAVGITPSGARCGGTDPDPGDGVEWPACSGVIWTSDDGTEWSTVALFENAQVMAIAEIADRLVAVGSGAWTSEDGLNWAPVEDPDIAQFASADVATLHRTAVAGDQIFVLEWGGRMWSSSDGLAWSEVPDRPELLWLVATDGDGVVGLVADQTGEFGLPAGDIALERSTDLETWQRLSLIPGSADYEVGQVAVTGHGYFVQGSPRDAFELHRGIHLWSSPDGVSWTETDLVGPDDGIDRSWYGGFLVEYDGGLVLVGGYRLNNSPEAVYGAVFMSSDGINWEMVSDRSRVFWGWMGLAAELSNGELIVFGSAPGAEDDQARAWIRATG
jgi:hypothetical protein